MGACRECFWTCEHWVCHVCSIQTCLGSSCMCVIFTLFPCSHTLILRKENLVLWAKKAAAMCLGHATDLRNSDRWTGNMHLNHWTVQEIFLHQAIINLGLLEQSWTHHGWICWWWFATSRVDVVKLYWGSWEFSSLVSSIVPGATEQSWECFTYKSRCSLRQRLLDMG